MSEFGKAINPFFISIIRLGEGSNRLSESFEYIVDYIEVSRQITAKTRKAIIYPTFLISMLFIMVMSSSIFLIPKMIDFSLSLGIKMPVYTLALKSFADFVRLKWHFIIFGSAGLIMFITIMTRVSEKFRFFMDGVKLKIPIVSSIIIKSNMARFCLFFSIAYKSGTNVVECLSYSTTVISNNVIKKSIAGMSESVFSGTQISDAISESAIVPLFVVRMFKIGENTSDISRSLDNVVSFYTEEINNLSDNIIATIKPAGILIAGAMMIWIISSTILPIYTQFVGKLIQ